MTRHLTLILMESIHSKKVVFFCKMSKSQPWLDLGFIGNLLHLKMDLQIYRMKFRTRYSLPEDLNRNTKLYKLKSVSLSDHSSKPLEISNFVLFPFISFPVILLRLQVKSSINFFQDGVPYNIETSPLICRSNQWAGFYVTETSVK